MASDDVYGYCLLSMPSDQIKPLNMLTLQEKGVANTSGIMIKDLFVKSKVGLPLVSQDFNLSTDLSKALTIELSVDSNITLLEALLKFVKLTAAFKLQKNRSVNLHLIEPKKNIVNEFKLDAYINNAKLNDISPTYTEMLRNNEMFVITDILKCRKYSFEYVNNRKTEAGIEANASKIGEAKADFDAGKIETDKLTSEGDKFLTIGVKAYRIFYIKDQNTGKESYRIRQDANIKRVKGAEKFRGEILQAEKVMLLESDNPNYGR